MTTTSIVINLNTNTSKEFDDTGEAYESIDENQEIYNTYFNENGDNIIEVRLKYKGSRKRNKGGRN